jgi:uncharacterized protein
MTSEIVYGPLQLLILQATPFCNISCDYCYLPDRDSTVRMDPRLVGIVLQRLFESPIACDDFTIVWHAGEPMTAGKRFFQAANEEIRARNANGARRITQSMQTNGTLLTKEWCQLFKDLGMRVGLSLDGPKELHDLHRKSRQGRGSHARVLRSLDLLREEGIDYSVIAVVTRAALLEPHAFFDFFIEAGVTDLCLNIDETEGVHLVSSIQSSSYSDYRAFIEVLYKQYLANGRAMRVREFEEAETALLGGYPVESPLAQPFKMLTVDASGNYSTFSPELLGQSSEEYRDFIIGNVVEPISAGINGAVFSRMSRDVATGVSACRQDCQHFAICGGGAPANKYFENGSFSTTETQYCVLTKKIITEVVLDVMTDQLLELQNYRGGLTCTPLVLARIRPWAWSIIQASARDEVLEGYSFKTARCV